MQVPKTSPLHFTIEFILKLFYSVQIHDTLMEYLKIMAICMRLRVWLVCLNGQSNIMSMHASLQLQRSQSERNAELYINHEKV